MNNILQCHEIVKTDFVKAENCYLYDKEGKQYVDFESGIWCTILGHCHPRINSVMEAQIKKVVHLGTRYPHFIAQETAKDILDIVGVENGKCVFLSSGSEAVEFGVQIARRVTEKPLFLTFSNSYLAAYGSAGKKDSDEWELFDWSACEHGGQCDCLDKISFENIGGFVFEPGGSGSGFVKFPPKQLVKDITHRVKQKGGILVVNEITTGIGRTGKWFGFQHYDIQPDIVAIGKGIGNGYPISAVAVRRDIAEKIECSGFGYAQSHQNDPLGCSIAKEVITVLKVGDLIEKGNALGAFFLDGLKRIERRFDVVKDTRGRGLLLALEFYPHAQITATWAYHALLAKGFLVGYYPNGNILRFDPALTVDKKDIERLLACIESIIESTG
jgi:4-aminobutyrate aminotransferase-like enzyme